MQDSITKKIIVGGNQSNSSGNTTAALWILDSLGNIITQKGTSGNSFGSSDKNFQLHQG